MVIGEFGVVYKADYTEPEGEISYKTTIVAVKTLKGNTQHYCCMHVYCHIKFLMHGMSDFFNRKFQQR